MAIKKSSRKSGTQKSKSKRQSSKRKQTTNTAAGTYIVPRGHVSIGIPAFWTLRQTNDDLEVEAPSGSTSVVVTAFQRNGRTQPLDAREYLEHFLETAPSNGRLKRDLGNKKKATARFRDEEGDQWNVAFVTNGTTLLLATCNTSFPATHKEAKTGLQVLESLKLI